MGKIKVLVSYHKPDILFKSDILVPIHVGRALAKQNKNAEAESQLNFMLSKMIGDDTGNNISEKNKSYNEMTGIYWAWKNYEAIGSPDYIGFMHYRRHFIVKDLDKSYYEVNNIDDNYLEKTLNFTKESLGKIFDNYDFIAKIPYTDKTVYEDYKENHRIEDLLKAIDITKKLYPEYCEACDKYINGKNIYFLNMFIFKKDIFFQYTQWVFNILNHFEKEVDISNKRLFISERLTGIFIQYILDKGYKGKFLPTMYIEEAVNIPVAISITKDTIIQSKATIFSILSNIKKTSTCELNIFVNENEKKYIENELSSLDVFKNFKVKYLFLPEKYIDSKEKIGFFNTVKLHLPLIIEEKKCIYLENNIIVNEDLTTLFRTNIDDYLIAGIVKPFLDENDNSKNYELNTNLLVINCAKIRNIKNFYENIDYDSEIDKIITDLYNNEFKILPLRNNVIEEYLSDVNGLAVPQKNINSYYSEEQVQRAILYPHTIAFTKTKPWENPLTIRSEKWFKYERLIKDANTINDLVSIIMTVYNSEKYIHETLNSITNQTYTNYELICVNDGSSDNSLKILEKYSNNDERIKIISHHNQGAAISRNVGIKHAKGEFILILDSDDIFEPELLSKLVYSIKNNNSEIAICKSVRFDNDTKAETPMPWALDISKIDNGKNPFSLKEIKNTAFTFCCGWAWDKLFTSKFIKRSGLQFQDLKNTNDAFFVFCSISKARSLSYVDEVLVKHRVNNQTSISKSREKDWQCFYLALTEIRKELIKTGIYYFLEKSYINWVLTFSVWYVSSLSYPLKNSLICFLKDIVFKELEFENYSAEYFENKSNYEFYLSIKNLPTADGVAEKLRQVANGNIDINSIGYFLEYDKIGMKLKQQDRKLCELSHYALNANKNTQKNRIVVPIVLAANEFYFSYATAAIVSIISNGTKDHYYDFYILYSNICEEKLQMAQTIKGDNFGVKCVNVIKYLPQGDVFYVNQHISKETYYRFFIPDIFPDFKKVIYIDCDVIALGDLAELYNLDIGNNVLAAVNNSMQIYVNDYVQKSLNLDPTKYINAGVLIINTDKFKEKKIREACFELLITNKNLKFLDQDAINIVCKNQIYFLPLEWNFQWHHYLEKHKILYDNELYYKVAQAPKIIHFTTKMKAWNSPRNKYTDFFWQYAAKAPFFNEIIHNNIKTNNEQQDSMVALQLSKQCDEKSLVIDKINKEYIKLKNDYSNIVNSKSFRIGRILTWPYRMVRGFFHCWKEHGFKYTMVRVRLKIKFILNKRFCK